LVGWQHVRPRPAGRSPYAVNVVALLRGLKACDHAVRIYLAAELKGELVFPGRRRFR
jgi:hypothetical protein